MTMDVAAMNFGFNRGASDEHTRHGSARSEQQRVKPKGMPPGLSRHGTKGDGGRVSISNNAHCHFKLGSSGEGFSLTSSANSNHYVFEKLSTTSPRPSPPIQLAEREKESVGLRRFLKFEPPRETCPKIEMRPFLRIGKNCAGYSPGKCLGLGRCVSWQDSSVGRAED